MEKSFKRNPEHKYPTHKFAVGELVEIFCYDSRTHGVRLFICNQGFFKEGDQTLPCYDLALSKPDIVFRNGGDDFQGQIMTGVPEKFLSRTPQEVKRHEIKNQG